MHKKAIIFFLSFCFLTGCYDKVEIDDWSYVITIGIDKANPYLYEDIKDKDRFVVCLAIPQPTEKQDGNKKIVKIASGETVTEAINEINAKSSRKMFFGHAKVVALGEGILSDSQLLREALDYLERNQEISMSLYVLAAKNNIYDVLNGTASGEPMVAQFVTNFYKNNKNSVEVAFKKDLESVIRDLYASGDTAMPNIVLQDDEVTLKGSSVIGNFLYRGELSDDDTRGFLISLGKAKGSIVTVYNEDVPIPFKILSCDNKIIFSIVQGHLVCTNNISLTGTIEENVMGGDSLLDDNAIHKLEDNLRHEIKNQTEVIYNKLQNRYRVDTGGLMERLKKDNYNVYKLFENNLDDAYRNMDIIFNVDVTVKGIGVIQ